MKSSVLYRGVSTIFEKSYAKEPSQGGLSVCLVLCPLTEVSLIWIEEFETVWFDSFILEMGS
jgi:hypothetical protein